MVVSWRHITATAAARDFQFGLVWPLNTRH